MLADWQMHSCHIQITNEVVVECRQLLEAINCWESSLYLGLISRNSSESKRCTATTVGQTRCRLSMVVVGPDLQREHTT